MNNSITLEMYINGTWTPVEDLSLLSLIQREISQEAGFLEWTYEPEDINSPFKFNVNDRIGLRGRNTASAPWEILFSGIIQTDTARVYGRNSAIDSVVAYDLWDTLDRTVWQTEQFVPAAFNRSHVTLFRNQDGINITTGEQIKAVLDYIKTFGVPLDYVQSDLDALTVVPPTDEQTDLACSEVIRKALRWHMDVFTLLEHRENESVIRFLSEKDERALKIPLSDCIAAGRVEIQKRSDMALRGVSITYEIENRWADNTVTAGIKTYHAGEERAGPNVLIATAQVDNTLTIENPNVMNLECVELPPSSVWYNAGATGDWSALTSFVSNFGTVGDRLNHVRGYETDWAKFRYAIKSGWKEGFGINVSSEKMEWQYISGGRGHNVSLYILLTNTPSGIYERPGGQDFIPGDPIPGDVAELLFAHKKRPLHTGTFTRQIQSVETLITQRNSVSITGGLPEYETMRSPVQRSDRDWFQMLERIKFGYPEQAGVNDFIDYLRINRSSNRPSRRTWRT